MLRKMSVTMIYPDTYSSWNNRVVGLDRAYFQIKRVFVYALLRFRPFYAHTPKRFGGIFIVWCLNLCFRGR